MRDLQQYVNTELMFEDEESISDIIREYGGRTCQSELDRRENPFVLPPPVNTFGWREELKRTQNEKRAELRKMTLLQRTASMKPKIPPCCSQTKRSSSVMSNRYATSESELQSLPKSNRRQEHTKRMADFIQQKREIFIVQMLIDKKNKDIRHMQNSMQREESNLKSQESQISRKALQYKMMSAQCESKLVKGRKRCESATALKVDIIKAMRHKHTVLSMIRSDISKHEEMLDAYRSYHEFLTSIAPEGQDPLKFFHEPQTLVDELNSYERSNFYLLERCQELENRITRGSSMIDVDMAQTDADIEKMKQKYDKFMSKHNSEENEVAFSQKKKNDDLDSELHEFTVRVRDAYFKCFRKQSDQNCLAILTEIENQLENFYKRLALISPAFIQEKQAVKDKERREEQRRLKQEHQEQEQHRKMEQAIERANKPIKKRTGRPIFPRSKPIHKEKKDDAKLLAQLEEQRRTEELLYGSTLDY